MKLEHTEDFAYATRVSLENNSNWGHWNTAGPLFWNNLADLYFIDVIQVAPWFE